LYFFAQINSYLTEAIPRELICFIVSILRKLVLQSHWYRISKNQQSSSPSNILALHCGNYHTFLVREDGVFSSGCNSYGQLGLGDKRNRNQFTKVPLLPRIVAVACGCYHTIVTSEEGSLYSCGFNVYGQLGIGMERYCESFTLVPNLRNILVVACYNHSLALSESGHVYACGNNTCGQLGIGEFSNQSYFVQVDISDIVSISCDGFHSLALNESGCLYVCGANMDGQLGLGHYYANQSVFIKVSLSPSINNIIQIAAGGNSSFLLTEDGSLFSTGYNLSGELGLGDTMNRNAFQKVNLSNLVLIGCGCYHTFVVDENGAVYSCGPNEYGQLGHGDTRSKRTFTKLASLPSTVPIVSISGGYHSFMLNEEGDVFACGFNGHGQLGLGDHKPRTEFLRTTVEEISMDHQFEGDGS